MKRSNMSTAFAPAERSDPKVVKDQADYVARHLFISKYAKDILDALPDGVIVLNSDRQIVFANKVLLCALGADDLESVLGLRPGEALNCVHANESDGGCGTTENCSQCGAVLAILAAQKGEDVNGECRVLLEGGDAMDLSVYAKPLIIEGERFVLFGVVDISHEKRRRILERTFFHDVLNTSTLLSGYAEMAQRVASEQGLKSAAIILSTVRRLINEIQSQRNLLAAETNELEPDWKEVHSLELVNRLVEVYRENHLSEGISIVVDPESKDEIFRSDPVLLTRVLGNMMKNALEASNEGDSVTIGCRTSGDRMEFFVHNSAVMPREVQLQLFMRSFSTKSPDRGIGTYSMKLFTERYLNGKISFTSEEGKGTTFIVSYPVK